MQSSPSSLRRLLIADDAPDFVRRLEAELVEVEDVELIGTAQNGVEALAMFCHHAPDVVVLDYQMPGMDGLAVLKEIRKRDRSCLVIVLTIFADAALRKDCLMGGANFFLDKAHEVHRVVEILRASGRRDDFGSRDMGSVG